MPTLKMADEREWKRLLAAKVSEIAESEVGNADFTDFGNPATLKAAGSLLHVPGEVAFDLLVAYDKTEALGGRAWLEENADSSQIWDALTKAFYVVFPFVTSIGSLLREIQKQGMSGSGPASSLTNGLLPTGAPAPQH